jgi:Na+-translocating ferredoxin:NAD+ oxidoreductase subunit B
MNEVIITTIISLGSIGTVAAVILYWASQKFKVIEDPRIDEVEDALPASNCGGCGFAGCRNFAEACVKADELDDLDCPVGGNDVMKTVASILGKEVEQKDKKIAVLLCSGSPKYRDNYNQYDGAKNCTIVSDLYAGETDCQYGCLGLGECVEVCNFEAIYMNPITNLPEVVEENCTACNACIEICPKNILELRPAGKRSRRIYVSCLNEDLGGAAKKACSVACIGCSKCFKVCPHDAITMNNNLAYIHADACKLCRKCVDVCPTDSIHELNFPPPRPKKPASEKKTAEKTNNQSNKDTSSETK